ncbi:unnamed protein product, partial [Brenthis ino]
MALHTANVKIENVCRTCLSKEFKMLSVFEVRLGMDTLDNIIASITGVKIEQGDGLPSTICNDCKEKVVSAYDFKTRSQEAEVTLRGLLTRDLSNENNLIYEPDAVAVKTEHFVRDNHDVYMDLDLSLALGNVQDTYSDVDAVKCEEAGTQCKESYVDSQQSENANGKNESIKQSSKAENNVSDSTYCPVCGSSFADAEGLTKHAWERHADLMGPKKRGRPKKLLTSTILNKLSENGYNLKYLPDLKHKCMFCKENLKTKDDLTLHMLEHKDVKLLSCVICKKMYLNKNDLEHHHCVQTRSDLDHNKQGEPPDAQENGTDINLYKETLLQDVLIANGDMDSGNIEPCSECGEVFMCSTDLSKHRDQDHPELSSRCHLCDKVFATVKSAARHRAVCSRVERSFACTSCGLRFAHEVSLNKHILRAHAGQSVSVRFMDRDRTPPQHRCDTCNRRFYRKDLLARHAKIHKQIEKCFECDVCNKKFHRRDNLKSHMKVHNSPGESGGNASKNTCLCLYCGRSFSNSSNLIVHMRRHTGEKPYKCDFCGKGFPRSSDLQCHRRSHTGEKPCICGVCGKAFSRSNKLSRHMRVHTGVKPYKCPYCEKAFSQSNDLTLHVRRHTGDKPYVCELCGDRFIQGTALHNHRRAHGHYPTAPLVYTVQTLAQTN